MQNTTPAPASSPANLVTTYGLFILSILAILLVGFAWLFGRVDATTAINVVIVVLAGNGLITATMWQAAPGLVTNLTQFVSQLTGHIQALHAQQITAQAPQLATTKMPAVQAPAAPAVAQQPFPASPSASMLGFQGAPITAQTWQRGSTGG